MRKPSKRFGNLIRSTKGGLHDMLVEHKGEVEEWISKRTLAG